jgi:hypothetical protein
MKVDRIVHFLATRQESRSSHRNLDVRDPELIDVTVGEIADAAHKPSDAKGDLN